MRRIFVPLSGAAAAAPSISASAELVVTISKSQQRLAVTVDGVELHRWPVSTGRRGLDTPSGTFRPIRFERQWYSRKYDMSPMPYSVFFHGGYALHGTYETRRLGQAASHGCVRLLPVNAAALFALLRKEGKSDTRIVVTDAALPVAGRPMAEQPPPQPMRKAEAKIQTEIKVPLPPQFEPKSEPVFAAPRPPAKPAVIAALALPKPAPQALAHVPLPPAREAAAKPEPRRPSVPQTETGLVRVGRRRSGCAARARSLAAQPRPQVWNHALIRWRPAPAETDAHAILEFRR